MTKDFINTDETISNIFGVIDSNNITFIEFRFLNLFGYNFRILKPRKAVDENIFIDGFTFDGSSVDAWKKINNSDIFYY